MSEWADFIESYGYEAGDADAMDKIHSEWASIEREAKLKKAYESDLLKGKTNPKKSYHNSNVKKFGFNNFKPFGRKIQTFSKKPITLIYGPNSIGKSSFIHMAAYLRYINETKNLDFVNTDMFGDNINLGGFSKFIHKRDKNNSLTLEYEFEDCSEAIIDYCDIKVDENIVNALALFSSKDIIEIIENSEYYVQGIFLDADLNLQKSKENLVKSIDGYGSGINDSANWLYHKYSDVIDNDKYQSIIDELKEKRKKNDKCNFIDVSELDFLQEIDRRFNKEFLIEDYYKKNPYIYSGYYNIDINIDESFNENYYKKINFLSLKNIMNHIFLNDNGEFINEDTKSHFISDILIPHYINYAKLRYLSENELKNYEPTLNETKKELDSYDIKQIADKTIKIISDILLEKNFLKALQDSTIPLKISAQIEQFYNPNKIAISTVKYFVDNKLFNEIKFDGIDNDSKIMDEDIPNALDGSDQSLLPNIFTNLSEILNEKIFKGNEFRGYGLDINADKNKLHEKSTDILCAGVPGHHRRLTCGQC